MAVVVYYLLLRPPIYAFFEGTFAQRLKSNMYMWLYMAYGKGVMLNLKLLRGMV